MKRSPMPARRTPLRSVSPQARTRAKKKTPPRPRDTGPTPAQRRVVLERAGGACELCGRVLWTVETGWTGPHSVHHRQPRGAGGSRVESNGPERLLLLCGSATTPGGCHALVESQRALAYAHGWLVRRPTDPADVPVELVGGRVLLTTDGRYEEAA